MLEGVNNEWLREAYSDGLVVAALNTPVSSVVNKLNVESKVDDVNLNQAFGRIGVAAVWSLDHITGIETGYMQLSEFYPTFATIVQILRESFIEFDPFSVPEANKSASTIASTPKETGQPTGEWQDCCGGKLKGNSLWNSHISGNFTFYRGAAISNYEPATPAPYKIHVGMITENDCGGWHTFYANGITAYNVSGIWTDWQTLASNQCPNPSQPGKVNAKVTGWHSSQKYSWASYSNVGGSTWLQLEIDLP
jgi:hypothetical protein